MPSIDDAWQWAVDTCNDPNVGYSQGNYDQAGGRNGLELNGKKYYDCSSFINFALLAGGWETPSYAPNYNAFYTQIMPTVLADLGFHQIGTNAEIKPGDIGLTPSSHTEMCYSGGKLGTAVFMGAHTSNTTFENQVSIGSSGGNTSYANSSWEQIWRYEDGGSGTVTPTSAFSFYVAAAMCGNFWEESHLGPGVWESLTPMYWDYEYEYTGVGGYGFGQWTNVGTSHGRLYKLSQYLGENGYDADSGDGQCAYVVKESYWGGAEGQQELLDFLSSDSTDLESLTRQWMLNWEGIDNGTFSERYSYAQKAFDYLQDHWDDNVNWVIGNKWLSESEFLNNCCCLYQWFNLNYSGGTNNGTGGGSTSSGKDSSQTGETVTDFFSLFAAMLGDTSTSDLTIHITKQRDN